MKNFITILIILIAPILIYLFITKDNPQIEANAFENNKPTIITFSSTMCFDCQRIKPIIKELETEYNTKTNFIYINATEQNEKNKEQIDKYNIQLVPTMIILNQKGELHKRFEGYTEKEMLIKDIEAVINE